MTELKKFRNAIICDDIRDEIGNKKSLMGVMNGDIFVATFPATIPLAIYLDYQHDSSTDKVIIDFRLMQDDVQIAQGNLQVPLKEGQPASFIIPRGYVSFDKPRIFRVLASIDGQPEEEILRKKIDVTSSTSGT